MHYFKKFYTILKFKKYYVLNIFIIMILNIFFLIATCNRSARRRLCLMKIREIFSSCELEQAALEIESDRNLDVALHREMLVKSTSHA